jgi:hypothetical protein
MYNILRTIFYKPLEAWFYSQLNNNQYFIRTIPLIAYLGELLYLWTTFFNHEIQC